MKGSAAGNVAPGVEQLSIKELSAWAPALPELLDEMGIQVAGNEEASLAWICSDAGVEPAEVFARLEGGGAGVESATLRVTRLEVVGGHDKKGAPEPVRSLVVRPGEVIAVVGPTGSGKSQFLSDVASLAQGDSPSGRRVLLNGAAPSDELRWASAVRPVAQVSQGMNFLLDLAVGEFLELHASCRSERPEPGLPARVVDAACSLCGEPFGLDTPIVSLSGGQSRALMITDAALISRAPIILVDEIENAGIDREMALRFLVGEGKITFIATHDPLLALSADRRIILSAGAIRQTIGRSLGERALLAWLEVREREVLALRERIRQGRRLAPVPSELLERLAPNRLRDRIGGLIARLRRG